MKAELEYLKLDAAAFRLCLPMICCEPDSVNPKIQGIRVMDGYYVATDSRVLIVVETDNGIPAPITITFDEAAHKGLSGMGSTDTLHIESNGKGPRLIVGRGNGEKVSYPVGLNPEYAKLSNALGFLKGLPFVPPTENISINPDYLARFPHNKGVMAIPAAKDVYAIICDICARPQWFGVLMGITTCGDKPPVEHLTEKVKAFMEEIAP